MDGGAKPVQRMTVPSIHQVQLQLRDLLDGQCHAQQPCVEKTQLSRPADILHVRFQPCLAAVLTEMVSWMSMERGTIRLIGLIGTVVQLFIP